MKAQNGAATTAVELIRECHDWRESHEHNRSCGPCKECRGTGKDLISYIFRSKKTRAKCPVCKGTRIRSQEFELSNQLTMEDLIEDMYLLIESDIQEVVSCWLSSFNDNFGYDEDFELAEVELDEYDIEIIYEHHYDSFQERLEYKKEVEQRPIWDQPGFTIDQILDFNDDYDLDLYLHLLAEEDADEALQELQKQA